MSSAWTEQATSHDTAAGLPATEAAAAVRVGLWVSAARCVLTYVVAPAAGLLGVALPVFGVVLQIAGAITSTAGARRLWTLGHRTRVPYAIVALAVDVLAVVSVVQIAVPGGAR